MPSTNIGACPWAASIWGWPAVTRPKRAGGRSNWISRAPRSSQLASTTRSSEAEALRIMTIREARVIFLREHEDGPIPAVLGITIEKRKSAERRDDPDEPGP